MTLSPCAEFGLICDGLALDRDRESPGNDRRMRTGSRPISKDSVLETTNHHDSDAFEPGISESVSGMARYVPSERLRGGCSLRTVRQEAEGPDAGQEEVGAAVTVVNAGSPVIFLRIGRFGIVMS